MVDWALMCQHQLKLKSVLAKRREYLARIQLKLISIGHGSAHAHGYIELDQEDSG